MTQTFLSIFIILSWVENLVHSFEFLFLLIFKGVNLINHFFPWVLNFLTREFCFWKYFVYWKNFEVLEVHRIIVKDWNIFLSNFLLFCHFLMLLPSFDRFRSFLLNIVFLLNLIYHKAILLRHELVLVFPSIIFQ